MSAQLAAIDWGASNARAFLCTADGTIVDSKKGPWGVAGLNRSDFPDLCEKLIGSWIAAAPDTNVLLAGMIGSSLGWIETPYLPCPVTINDIAENLTSLPDTPYDFRFTPGVSCTGNGKSDVMRGEEIQILGAAASAGEQELFVLPGTHSKWTTFRNGRIESVSTLLSGELFAILGKYSTLSSAMDMNQPIDHTAFEQGVLLSKNRNLLGNLFQLRVGSLLQDRDETYLTSLASGMILGEEISAMSEQHLTSDQVVLLVGNVELCRCYKLAFDLFDVQAKMVDGETAFVSGACRLALASGIFNA